MGEGVRGGLSTSLIVGEEWAKEGGGLSTSLIVGEEWAKEGGGLSTSFNIYIFPT